YKAQREAMPPDLAQQLPYIRRALEAFRIPILQAEGFEADDVIGTLGVPPEKVVDVMALRGDSIDNIPGAPGIGDKGSVELIQQFGTVEAALDRAEEIKRKTYRESLQNNRDNI